MQFLANWAKSLSWKEVATRFQTSWEKVFHSVEYIEEWGEVFSDSVLAQAAIDRIFDRAQIVVFKGKSYRLKGKIKLPQIDILKNIG